MEDRIANMGEKIIGLFGASDLTVAETFECLTILLVTLEHIMSEKEKTN